MTTAKTAPARDYGAGFFIKLIIMAFLNGIGIYGISIATLLQSWTIVVVSIALLIVLDVVYFSKKMLAAKYLVPGMIFLCIFQIFVMGYTAWASLTNYGTGHNSDMNDAVQAILMQNEKRVEGAPTVKAWVGQDADNKLSLIIQNDEGQVSFFKDKELVHVADVNAKKDLPKSVTDEAGVTILSFKDLVKRQKEITNLRLAAFEDINDGYYITPDGSKAYLAKSLFDYNKQAQTLTNTDTGVVFSPNDHGQFESPDGQLLDPGWRVFVGAENYLEMGIGPDLAGVFIKAFIWSAVFAVASVVTTFALGLALALVFNDDRIKGKRIYRSLLILPYAFPAFLSVLVWRGMLNERFGFFNQIFLGGAEIPWLTDGLLAKFSIIGVNLWLGFPYMFLVCMGALQGLPTDILEAAKIDGATPLRTIRSIILPLILQATTPLLISGFAFNFNNFAIIYMLTGGGPSYPGLSLPVGETDILISMVYKIAFAGGTNNYGLASALSIVIFVVVGFIGWLGFKQTKTLEQM